MSLYAGITMHPYKIKPCGIDVIPTGSLRLDIALGTGGVPRGQIVEVGGPEGCGKTTLALHLAAQAQRSGGNCAVIDVDGTLDRAFAMRCRVDPDRLYVCQPAGAEQALETLQILVSSGSMVLVVLDSLYALVSAAEFETRLGQPVVAPPGRRFSFALAPLAWAALQTNTTVLFITPGDLLSRANDDFGLRQDHLALKAYTSTCLRLRLMKSTHHQRDLAGRRVEVQVVKHQFIVDCRTIELDIMYNDGIDRVGEILDLAIEICLIHQRAQSFFYRDLLLGDGREEALIFLHRRPDLLEKIERVIRLNLLPPAPMQVDL